MLSDNERGRLRPSVKQIIHSQKLPRSSIEQRLELLKAPEENGTKINHGKPKKVTILQ